MNYAGQKLFVGTGPRALPQGACTSPALSNLAARRLDSRLSGIARKLGCVYTRYADDLTLSADGDAAAKVGYLLARLRHIAQDEGFAVVEPPLSDFIAWIWADRPEADWGEEEAA